jgi:hypothetical protein
VLLSAGNELNLATTDYPNLYSLVDAARTAAHNIEGINWHPVATPTADGSIGSRIYNYDYSVDVWAVQIYRGASFGSLWTTLKTNTSKPAIMSEFGIDSWDNRTGMENQTAQAYFDSKLFSEIVANNATCTGATVFQWMDGWWKGGNSSVQLTTGSTCNGAANDGVCNSAWLGINSVSAGIPNIVTPKQAYFSLQTLFLSTDPYGTGSTTSGSGSSSLAIGLIIGGCVLVLVLSGAGGLFYMRRKHQIHHGNNAVSQANLEEVRQELEEAQ